jgi:pimeloyl-ACP methyl ester carboxylesterase
MKNKFLLVIIGLIPFIFQAQASEKTNLYLLAGQGADERLFKNLVFSDEYEVHYIAYSTPTFETSLTEYACTLSRQIDQTEPFVLLGVSLGGMLATEMCDFLNPEKTIIIASAKNVDELPRTFNFQKKVPLYKLAGKRNVKWGARFLQPIFEPDGRKEKETYRAMLDDKDPQFLLKTIPMIMTWERKQSCDQIIHIHGTKDHTIPFKNVKSDYVVEGGSHMMTLVSSEELNIILAEIL